MVRKDLDTSLIPMNAEEANQLVELLGNERRELARIEAAMNDEIAEIKARCEADAAVHQTAVINCSAALREWASTNRAELTDGGLRKSFKLPAGELGWRANKPRVSLGRKRAIAGILIQIHAMAKEASGAMKTRLLGFIRTTEEIDKQAMLAEPDLAASIPGVKIKSGGEEFYVTPYELPLSDGTGAAAEIGR